MADPDFLREGKRRFAPVDAATVIKPGQLLALISGEVVLYTGGSDFLGQSEGNSRADNSDDVRVQCERSQADIDVVSANYIFGQVLEHDSADKLVTQSAGQKIAIAIETKSSATRLRVEYLKPHAVRP